MPDLLTPAMMAQAVEELISRDRMFATIVSRYSLPPFWQREPGFPTLLHIILEQQVSLASAQAAYNRLLKRCSPLTAQNFLQLTDSDLKQIGFSRQKTGYGRAIAQSILDNTLALGQLETLNDGAVRDHLMGIKGIGVWTANTYLLMALRRPDVWPKGDLALQVAIQTVKALPKRPTAEEAAIMSAQWHPWRAVAARLLWHFYLSERQQTYS
ncbi:MAG: DNA-3-methyladenine glycosylase 2 family protein [Cyanobacteria bacterium P01_D01_bin.156]